jgi:hypothetical protein
MHYIAPPPPGEKCGLASLKFENKPVDEERFPGGSDLFVMATRK